MNEEIIVEDAMRDSIYSGIFAFKDLNFINEWYDLTDIFENEQYLTISDFIDILDISLYENTICY
jgi:hypothetical protein